MGADDACPHGTPSWTNYARNQNVYAKHVVRPSSLPELREAIREVGGRRGRMRAVATGLSFSDILQTDDTLVVLTDLHSETAPGALLPLEEHLWREPGPTEPLVRAIAGARLRELNDALARAGLAFQNLGGFDGQTLIGAISTSTHGSGLSLGPLSSAVRSMDFVSTDGALYRIEPCDGITDPAKFARAYGSKMTLVQDDSWFNACVVSLGCMGVIYSATVAVRSSYRLLEHKRRKDWSVVKSELASRKPLCDFRHYEVFVNPYPRRDGDHTCLVTERSIAPPDAAKIPVPKSVQDATTFTFLPGVQKDLVALMNGDQRLIPGLLEYGFQQLESRPSGVLDDSFRIFNVGKINGAKVLSGEYFLPLEGDRFIAAVDKLIGVITKNATHGVYQTAPLSLRFVRGSDAFLSMAQGRDTCTIEIAMFTEGRGAVEALLSYEAALYELGARPHWAQLHQLTGARGWLKSAYPRAGDWLNVFGTLNAKGIFDNAFTDRLNISTTPRKTRCVP